MRVSFIGYGAVADVHARGLKAMGSVRLAAVAGPSAEKAGEFAARHSFERATTILQESLHETDAVIVCSPSNEHARQAMLCLESRVPVLVELPACSTLDEAIQLQATANRTGTLLQCAHTARYLEPFLRVRELVKEQVLGEIQQLAYLRLLQRRSRSWSDDALLHHAAHIVDLWLDWFGPLEFQGCVAKPFDGPVQSVSILARLPCGASATISVVYDTHMPECRMALCGSLHTVFTDGFSHLDSDEPRWRLRADAGGVYHAAIQRQDEAFLSACSSGIGGVPWTETVRLIQALDEVRRLADRGRG